MQNTNNKIPIVSLNKSDICSNIEHPIPSQELNPSSQNITQTICAISLINRPQPCGCRYFSAALFLPPFFCCMFSAMIFLSHFFLPQFFYRIFSVTLFLPRFLCRTFCVAVFLPYFFLPFFSDHTFSGAHFLPQFSAALFLLQFFSINNTYPNNLLKIIDIHSFSSVIKMRQPCLLFILSCSFLKGLHFNHLNPLSLF
jgi:hypothetical protein